MKRDKDKGMWTLVMYDLPIKTKEDAGAANRFNHLLADLGFFRVQILRIRKIHSNTIGRKVGTNLYKSWATSPRKCESVMCDGHSMGGFVEIHR